MKKITIYVIIIMVATAFGLKAVYFLTKRGEVKINSHVFKVELARKSWELERGLSGKNELKEDKGMFFVFPSSKKHGIWMKGMEFPIDILWIDNGKIVDIKENAPVPITQKYIIYKPKQPARYVLEINAGLSEKYGFQIGDKVILDI